MDKGVFIQYPRVLWDLLCLQLLDVCIRGPIIAVIGDGSIMMNLQELQTVAHHNIPLKIFVINNNAYAIINRRQKELFEENYWNESKRWTINS